MYKDQNSPICVELLSTVEKAKIEMIVSHIILNRLSGTDRGFNQTWSALQKRRHLQHLNINTRLFQASQISEPFLVN